MAITAVPDWMANLDEEDVAFIKKFVVASGSLKEMASQYSVSYPTMRLRVDRLIQKIQLGADKGTEPYVRLIKKLAVNDRMGYDTAKILVSEYRKMKGEQLAAERAQGIAPRDA